MKSQSYGAHSRTKFKSAVKPLILHAIRADL